MENMHLASDESKLFRVFDTVKFQSAWVIKIDWVATESNDLSVGKSPSAFDLGSSPAGQVFGNWNRLSCWHSLRISCAADK